MNPISMVMRLTGLSKVASTIALIALVLTLIGVGKCAYDASVQPATGQDRKAPR